MITVSSFVSVLDFGFAPQLARSLTYVFNGSQRILKTGIVTDQVDPDNINYELLNEIIQGTKFLYKVLSIIILVFLIIFGSLYFSSIPNFLISPTFIFFWLSFSASTSFSVHFSYFSSLLIGRKMVRQYYINTAISKLCFILVSLITLFLAKNLLSIVLANFLSSFLFNILGRRQFYDEFLKEKLEIYKSAFSSSLNTLKILSINASKTGLVYLGNFLTSRISLIISGLYLSLSDVASYGLLLQFTSLISVFSLMYSVIKQPQIISLITNEKKSELFNLFSLTYIYFVVLFTVASFLFLIFGKVVLEIFNANAVLPEFHIVIITLFVYFLETHHSFFVSFITCHNYVLNVRASILTGMAVVVSTFLIFKYSQATLLSLVCIQGIIQLLYNNWAWPYFVWKKFNFHVISLFKNGLKQLFYFKNNS